MTFLPKILIASLAAGAVAQILKAIIKSRQRGTVFNWKFIDDYGGMPSAHAAFLASLSTAVALTEGVFSTAFAICIIVSIILIRDALGFRMLLENHGRILDKLVKKNLNNHDRISTDQLARRIGHTWLEILVGALIGTAIAFALFYII